MRLRSFVASMLLAGGTVALLAGCSARPENSPQIKKKFAEYDKQGETIERLNADMKLLNDQVAMLIQENEQLKAFLPDVDGSSAVDKIGKLEARLKQVESMAATGVMSAAAVAPSAAARSTTTASATAPTSSKAVDLEAAPLAGAPARSDAPAAAVSSAPAAPVAPAVVAQQQEAPRDRAPMSFKEKTTRTANTAKKEASEPKPASKPAAKPAAAKPANRGTWHVIAAGETIDQVAAKYGTTRAAILESNKIPAGARPARGQRLFIPAK